MGPPLKLVNVLMGGIPSFQCVNCTTQRGVISKLAVDVLSATVQVTKKILKTAGPNANPRGVLQEYMQTIIDFHLGISH